MPCLSKSFTIPFALLVATVAQVLGQASPFEPADFNATEALLDIGFDPAAIPPVGPENAVRSVSWNCRAAVRVSHSFCSSSSPSAMRLTC